MQGMWNTECTEYWKEKFWEYRIFFWGISLLRILNIFFNGLMVGEKN